MAIIQPPGLRTARLYVWLLICSPALLFLSGAVLIGVGIGFDQSGVAVLGAAGVLAGLVLPHVVGRFEFGPRGARADMRDIQLYTDLITTGMEGGLTPGTAVEVAIDAAEDAGVGEAVHFWSDVARSATELPSQALPMWNESVRRGLARQNMSEAIGLEGEVERGVGKSNRGPRPRDELRPATGRVRRDQEKSPGAHASNQRARRDDPSAERVAWHPRGSGRWHPRHADAGGHRGRSEPTARSFGRRLRLTECHFRTALSAVLGCPGAAANDTTPSR
jgi:hypothetical protein